MRIVKDVSRPEAGVATLLLVLIVAVVVSILSMSILMFTLFSRKVSQVGISTTQSLYVAESHLFDLVEVLKDNPDYFTYPYETIEYLGENTKIYKSIIQTDTGYIIKIISEVNGANRTLEAYLGLSKNSSNVLDVMLVIDKSGDLGSAINIIKTAATNFVDIVYSESSVDAQVGMVYFEDGTPKQDLFPLTTTPLELKSGISSANASGGNNFELALRQATEELDKSTRSQSKKVMVIFADGIPSESLSNSCPENFCFWNSPTGFSPDDGGHACTADAIQQANRAKFEPKFGDPLSRDYTIFSISFLGNYNKHNNDCSNQFGSKDLGLEKTKELGRRTLLRVSSQDPTEPLPAEGQDLEFYYEAVDASEINDVFTSIANEIIKPGFFSYQEISPEPIPEI